MILVFSAASRRLQISSSGCMGLISLAEPSLTGASDIASFWAFSDKASELRFGSVIKCKEGT